MLNWKKYKQYREFGWIVGGIFLAIALWPLYKQTTPIWWLAGIAGGFLGASFLYPPVLKPCYWIWMKIGGALGWLNTRILLSIIFYCLFTPTGLMMRLFGKDPLEKKFKSNRSSYWKDHNSIDPKESMENQF